jgi:hypothetical protein
LSNGDKKVTVTVIDSRGKNVTLDSIAFTVQPYSPPTITEFKVERKSDGTTIVATIKGKVSAVNGEHKSIHLYIGENEPIKFAISQYDFTETYTINNFADDGTVNCTVYVNDYYTSRKKEVVLPAVFVTADFHHSGKGIALGKVAEEDELFDVAWDTNIRKNLNVDGTLTLGGVPLSGNDLLNLSDVNSYGGKNTDIYNAQTVANSYGNTLNGASVNLAANSTYLVIVGVMASDGSQTAFSDILLANVETGGEVLISCSGRSGAYAGGGVCSFAVIKTTSATFARCQSHGYRNAAFNLHMRTVAIKLDA